MRYSICAPVCVLILSLISPGIALGTTVVCTVPVPTAAVNLMDLARRRPSIAHAAESNVRFLLRKYCRELDGDSVLQTDNSTPINENCWQFTGMLNGDRVYWASCLAEGQGE